MTDLFFALTPDVVLDAVESRGLRPTGHCTPLTCLENRVYDVRLEGGAHVVVKFYRPERWSRSAIAEEHAFLDELRRAEVPVCAPLGIGSDSLGEIEGIYFAVWDRIGGRAPDEFDDTEIEILGRLLARVHAVGATRPAPDRPVLDAETAGRAPLRALEAGGFLPESIAARFGRAVEELSAIYRECTAEVPQQRIHGDCHAGNLLRTDAGWCLLDFDDFLTGPAVHDVWMLLPGRDSESARQRSRLVDAYRELRPFDDRWLTLIEPLRGFRFVFYVAGPIELIGGVLLVIGLFTRWTAFVCSGLMAAAYWMAHGFKGLLPIQNHGELAVIYCFVFLYIAARGAGIWSVEGE